MTSSHRFISAVPAILLSASFLFASVDTNAADSTDFTGLGFGVGLSLTVDTGSNDRVKSASLVNGIVRVEDEDNAIARIMFESHYFFDPKGAMPITGADSAWNRIYRSNQSVEFWRYAVNRVAGSGCWFY